MYAGSPRWPSRGVPRVALAPCAAHIVRHMYVGPTGRIFSAPSDAGDVARHAPPRRDDTYLAMFSCTVPRADKSTAAQNVSAHWRLPRPGPTRSGSRSTGTTPTPVPGPPCRPTKSTWMNAAPWSWMRRSRSRMRMTPHWPSAAPVARASAVLAPWT